jgi:hypothetical protein
MESVQISCIQLTYGHVIFTSVEHQRKPSKAMMFTMNNDMQEAVVQWFGQQLREFFADGICWPVHHWVSCLNACGDFF